MDWLAAPDYQLARWLLERLLGVTYLVAFVSTFFQFPALLGEHGLVPVPEAVRRRRFASAPSIFRLHYSDHFARAIAGAGAVLALAVVLGLPQRGPLWACMLAWFCLWMLYLSFVNVGQPFYGFVWETLLLEAGVLAIFLGNARTVPPLLTIMLFRWLLFRLEVGAGLIKVRNDRAWRDLTALDYHHETQPIPGPLSWYVHHLPEPLHKVETAGNHVVQLFVPFLLFAPQPVAEIAGLVIIATQAWLLMTGNFAWLNLLTITLAVAALSNGILGHVLPVGTQTTHAMPLWFEAAVIALTVVVAVLSYRPVRNMLSRRQVMNASYNPVHFVNTYGLFGHITRERYEVVLEGATDGAITSNSEWTPYEFRAKPGDVRRRPRQVAPYHLRLDWMMWFAAISPAYADAWFVPFVAKLLEHDRAARRLLRNNPFPDAPPTYIRALLYRYRFTTRSERRGSGAWWHRDLIGIYLAPVALEQRERVPSATTLAA